MPAFSVNTDSAIELSAKLEKLHRSAFPLAVRGTLNDLAAESRLLAINRAETIFTNRTKNFFRSHIIFFKSKNTFDVNKMVSKVGVSGAPSKSKTGEGLAKQETGGNLKGRKLIPLKSARISGSQDRRLQRKHKFENIRIATRTRKRKGSKYMTIKSGGKTIVYDVSKKSWKPIYLVRNTRNTRLSAKPFMRPSSLLAAKKADKFYKINAEKRFKKALK